MSTTPTQTIKQRQAHHEALRRLAAELGHYETGLSLWRKLARVERAVYVACLDYTNGDNGVDMVQWEASKEKARSQVRAIFGGKTPAGFFVNGDPRGHMLKLDNDVREIPDGLEKDWGGHGLLAPTID